jgi:hypothetical protein
VRCAAARHEPFVALGGACEAAVEPAEEARLGVVVPASTGLSSVAHSAGVNDSAMKAENRMDTTITAANWR